MSVAFAVRSDQGPLFAETEEREKCVASSRSRLPCSGYVVLAIGTADASPKGKKVAYLATNPTHPFIAALSKSFVDKASSFGMEVTSFSTPFDAALQAQQVDDAIARKFDIIAIIAASEQAIVPALTRAKQAGMPVIMLNTPGKPGTEDLYVSFVGEDHVVLGRLTGESVLKALKEGGRDGGKVALITGSLQEGVGTAAA